jgi:hypothetical protein
MVEKLLFVTFSFVGTNHHRDNASVALSLGGDCAHLRSPNVWAVIALGAVQFRFRFSRISFPRHSDLEGSGCAHRLLCEFPSDPVVAGPWGIAGRRLLFLVANPLCHSLCSDLSEGKPAPTKPPWTEQLDSSSGQVTLFMLVQVRSCGSWALCLWGQIKE